MLSAASPSPYYARRYPLSYIFSGNYNWGSGYLGRQGTDGYWWASLAYSSDNAYDLAMDSGYFGPQSNGTKVYGFPLRSTSARRYPLSYVYSGAFSLDDGLLRLQNSAWALWSITANNSNIAYSFSAGSSFFYIQNTDNKLYSFSLRLHIMPVGIRFRM